MINKFYNNRIALLILSLFLSVLLFIYVKAEQYNENPVSFFQNVSEATTETIYNVPVYINGNVDEYYITGLPDAVSVSLSGPKNVIDQTLEADDFRVVTEDLDELGEGSHYIQLQMENVPNAVSYEISPSSVNISIDTLQTTEYPVQVNISNPDVVADGYTISDINLNTETVSLTGSTADIDSVNQVYTLITLPDNLRENYTATATVITENSDGDILNINTDPSEVDITVQVDPEGVSVPIELNLTNEQSDYTYEANIVGDTNATLSGDYDTIKALDSVTATVDVQDITATTTVDASIDLPNGVDSADPSSVQVQVIPTASQSESSVSSSSESSSSSIESSVSEEESAAESEASSADATSESSVIDSSTPASSADSDSISSESTSSASEVGITNTDANRNMLERNVQADEGNGSSSEEVNQSSSANVFNGILAFLASFFYY